VIGYKGLLDALALFEDKPKYQKLVIDFDYGENPDSAFSRVPYDKGANLLLHIGRLYLFWNMSIELDYPRAYTWWP
jgi:leukotriene-A4 hydrolase